MTLRWKHAGLTDRGRVREENQDRWFGDAQQGLYVVADGIGGGPAGGLAAQIVVDALPRLVGKRLAADADLAGEEAVQTFQSILTELSNRLYGESRDQPGLAGMGSTVVLALVRDRHALIAHMGDSRAYLLHQGRLELLTRDHSIVQLLIESGDIKPEEAADHPARGQLTRFVGMKGEPLPEVRSVDLVPGDVLLLCTDGLYGMLVCEQMAPLASGEVSLEAACHRLVDAANQAGGTDNITAVMIWADEDSRTKMPSGSVQRQGGD